MTELTRSQSGSLKMRLKEMTKFALIANLVFCAIVLIPLAVAALYQANRFGWSGKRAQTWRVIGLPGWLAASCLVVGLLTIIAFCFYKYKRRIERSDQQELR